MTYELGQHVCVAGHDSRTEDVVFKFSAHAHATVYDKQLAMSFRRPDKLRSGVKYVVIMTVYSKGEIPHFAEIWQVVVCIIYCATL